MILKCRTPEGNSFFSYNSSPSKVQPSQFRPAPITSIAPIVPINPIKTTKITSIPSPKELVPPKPAAVAKPKLSGGRSMKEQEYLDLNKAMRRIMLEQCKKDLKDTSLTFVPRARINFIGWPKNVKQSDKLSPVDCRTIIKMIEEGEIRFEWRN